MARPKSLFLTLGLAFALVLSACGGGDDTGGDAESEPSGGDASAADSDAGDGGSEAAGGGTSGDPIKIGFLGSLTGPFAPWGLQARDGMQMAIDELNEQDGIDGRPVELVEADDQNNPEEGVTSLERMVDDDGVIGAGGVISSDVGLATSRAAEDLEVPLFLVKAGSGAILSPDSRYTFRTCLPAAPMVAGPVAQYLEENNLTKAGAIIADYAWGQSVRAALEEEIGALEGVELQVEVAPVGEQDFTTYLRRLESFGPDVIVATGHPPGAGPITRQSAELGLDVPITGPYAPLTAVMEGVGDAAFDRYSDFGCADYTSDEYQELAARFAEQTGNSFMEDDAVAGYGMVQMLKQAVEEVGDDPAAIAEWLHGQSFDLPGYAFTMAWTEWGELAEAQPAFDIIKQMDPPEGINEGAGWYPERLILPEPLEPYQPE